MSTESVNYYDVLGVERAATDEEIKKAFRRLIRKAHPDLGGDPEEAARLTAAYDALIDEARRAQHDRDLASTGQGPEPEAPTTPRPEPTFNRAAGPSVPKPAKQSAGPAPRSPEPAGDGLSVRRRWILGGSLVLLAIVLVAGYIWAAAWLSGPGKLASPDRIQFGFVLASGLVIYLGHAAAIAALIAPERVATIAWPLAVGLAVSVYGEVALANDLPAQWIGELFSRGSWPYWGLGIAGFLIAIIIRQLVVPGVLDAWVGESSRFGGAGKKAQHEKMIADFDLFFAHHRDAGHRLYFTQPFTRGYAGAPAPIEATDLETGVEQTVLLSTRPGFDDQHAQWVLAVNELDTEVDRIEVEALAAWRQRHKA